MITGLPPLPKPPTFREWAFDLVSGRLHRRMRKLEQKLDLLRDHHNEKCVHQEDLTRYVQKVATRVLVESAKSTKDKQEIYRTLARVAGKLGGQGPLEPVVVDNDNGFDDEEPTTVQLG